MTSFLTAKDIVDVEDVIAVLVVIPVILNSLAGFSQNTSGVPRRLIIKCGVADTIGSREVSCERLKGLVVVSTTSYGR